jgi:hypothetical protein
VYTGKYRKTSAITKRSGAGSTAKGSVTGRVTAAAKGSATDSITSAVKGSAATTNSSVPTSTGRVAAATATSTYHNSGPDFVAFNHPSWCDKPLIGKVLEADGDTTKIHWWIGRYTGTWKPSMTRSREGPMEADVETINNDFIIHRFKWEINNNNTSKLPKTLITALKSAYS